MIDYKDRGDTVKRILQKNNIEVINHKLRPGRNIDEKFGIKTI